MATYSNFSLASSDGTLNSTTPVTIVAAPSGSNILTVKCIFISNTDTAPVVLTLRYVDSSTNRTIWSGTLNVGDTLQVDENDFLVLDTTSKSITAVLGGAITTNQPNYTACWSQQS